MDEHRSELDVRIQASLPNRRERMQQPAPRCAWTHRRAYHYLGDLHISNLELTVWFANGAKSEEMWISAAGVRGSGRAFCRHLYLLL
jgi:hypothetical protein